MTNPPAVYVLDPYHQDAVLRLKEAANIRLVLPNDASKDTWSDNATSILVRSETRITAEAIEKTSTLKYIVKQGVGVDNVDLDAAKQKGIQVFNTPGLNSEAVAELALALAFCVSRRICEMDRRVRNGEKIVRSQTLGKSLFRKTLGIAGMGNIGIEVARKWIGAMNGPVVAFDPYAPADAWHKHFLADQFERVSDLNAMLSKSDVVSLHVPLTKSTENLISDKQFAHMKQGAILLNCARGGVVDEDALIRALNSDRLFGVGLDAMLHEPPTLDAYGESLLSHPRVVLTPHVGASTEENQKSSGLAAVQIILDLLEGGTAAEKHQALN